MSDPELPALSVAGAARRIGVAPGTLRSWERRYGIAPSEHTVGGHRRYRAEDVARLEVMGRLLRQGVPPGEAARIAQGPIPADALGQPGGGHDIPEELVLEQRGGGRVLPMPGGSRQARGLGRAAMALDASGCREIIDEALTQSGVISAWEGLIRPVLGSIGERWQATERGVEIEHSVSAVVASCLMAHAAAHRVVDSQSPVLLASVPDELHDLPLLALHAALAEARTSSHVLGARTPQAALDDAVVRLRPPVVFLWSHRPSTPVSLPSLRPQPALVVGGPGWERIPPGAVLAPDLASAVSLVGACLRRLSSGP